MMSTDSHSPSEIHEILRMKNVAVSIVEFSKLGKELILLNVVVNLIAIV
jgi:hypothetical protein